MIRALLPFAILGALFASGAATAAVPTTIGFTAHLVDENSGDAVSGPHRIAFALYDREAGGTAVWQEAREVVVDEGALYTDLGSTEALDASVFDGKKLWLEVKLDDVTMEPRIAIDSVPYAVRAGVADTVGDLAADDVQKRVTGTCTTGNFIIGVNPDGTVTCAPDLSGSGDVTAVLAGTGLQGGGTSGELTLSLLQTCAPNQILKWNGGAWACANESGGAGGDITSVIVGPAGGLVGGAAAGDVQLSLLNSCAVNQVLKWNGTTWVCAIDVDTDTNSGGDITSVTTAVGTGLQGGASSGDAALSLLTTCAPSQVLKWNGSAWACASDTDTNSGGDITEVIAGTGLTGGATSGAATINVIAGSGITVTADAVSLDFNVTDTRYVNATGDSMTGSLNMGGQRVTNRGCATGYVLAGPGLCVEQTDAGSHTFSGCANRCRAAGTHMCTSVEMRAVIASGVSLPTSILLDWLGDQDGVDAALYIDANNAEAPDGTRSTASTGWCRCCASVE